MTAAAGPAAFAARPLPASLPIFPLSGVLLLPRGRLPLNIFEPRYLAMVDHALAGDRMIGMIQPTGPESPARNPPVYKTGCAGRIVSLAEDGPRYLLTLAGISRFSVTEELATTCAYRQVVADWTPYQADLVEPESLALDRARLFAGLKTFFTQHGIGVDWSALEKAGDERLVTSLAMTCPFSAAEKQALLEAPTLDSRAEILTSLVEMIARSAGSGPDNDARH